MISLDFACAAIMARTRRCSQPRAQTRCSEDCCWPEQTQGPARIEIIKDTCSSCKAALHRRGSFKSFQNTIKRSQRYAAHAGNRKSLRLMTRNLSLIDLRNPGLVASHGRDIAQHLYCVRCLCLAHHSRSMGFPCGQQARLKPPPCSKRVLDINSNVKKSRIPPVDGEVSKMRGLNALGANPAHR